jgi:hypothetical protein
MVRERPVAVKLAEAVSIRKATHLLERLGCRSFAQKIEDVQVLLGFGRSIDPGHPALVRFLCHVMLVELQKPWPALVML